MSTRRAGLTTPKRNFAVKVFIVGLLCPTFCPDAVAQIVVSANDSKSRLVDGVNSTVPNPPPDTVTIIEIGKGQPRILAELPVPNSIVGPPQNVALSPDGALALVTSSTKLDPADATKTAPDDKVTVIDLKASPPAVLTTLRAGNGASGVSINRAGTMALVANRFEGTVSVFTIAGKTVTPAGKVEVGTPESLLSGVVFTRDDRTALVTRNFDSLISVLSIDGSKVENTKRDFAANLKPVRHRRHARRRRGRCRQHRRWRHGRRRHAQRHRPHHESSSRRESRGRRARRRRARHLSRRPLRRSDGHERIERLSEVAALQRLRLATHLRAEQDRADARRRDADRPLVPGRGMERG